MLDDEMTINVTAFKATCLSLLTRLEGGKLRRITVTRRGKPVAELRPPMIEKPSLYGSMRGTVVFAPDYNPAEPAFDGEWDAQKGILHNG